jgi:hydroxyacylglutathione hydrolase
MIIEQIWTGNSYRNFNYLVACPETGEALAIDPLDDVQCLARAKELGWDVTQIVNTHEHRDHIGGNAAMVRATGAKLLAHEKAKIKGVDRGLSAGDLVRAGRTVEFTVMDTPGHTMTHICLLADSDSPVLISGDTLFAAGVGNCIRGGDPETLYDTIANQLMCLSDATRIYPGHDYLLNNLGFTIDREPDNEEAARLLRELQDADPAQHPLVTTLGLEREINSFLRLTSETIIHRLRESFPALPQQPTPKEVFLHLRQLRNQW